VFTDLAVAVADGEDVGSGTRRAPVSARGACSVGGTNSGLLCAIPVSSLDCDCGGWVASTAMRERLVDRG